MKKSIALNGLYVSLLGITVISILNILFYIHFHYLIKDSTSMGDVTMSYVLRLRYILWFVAITSILPLLCNFFQYLRRKPNKRLNRLIFRYYVVVWGIAIVLNIGNFPYYSHFKFPLSSQIFESIDSSFTSVKMVLLDSVYWPYFAVCILSVYCFYRLLKIIFAYEFRAFTYNTPKVVVVVLLTAFVSFTAIRGHLRFNRHPLSIYNSNFSCDPFLNQASLDPVFNVIKTYDFGDEDLSLNMCDVEMAKETVKKNHPNLDLLVDGDSINKKHKNLVLVIMESMSCQKMGRYGSRLGLTPFLDSLASVSVTYDRMYSVGPMTHYGLAGVLGSVPALFEKNQLKNRITPHFEGLPTSLNKAGYHNLFFIPHKEVFDNVRGFAVSNGYDEVYTEKNYPSEARINSVWGVADDFLFRYGVEKISKSVENKEMPFFATFLTISDHGPAVIPSYYSKRNNNIKYQRVAYADWSLRKLIDTASKTSWFHNTVFAFVADHGIMWNEESDMMDRFHIPFIIWDPSGEINATHSSNIASQLDVFPTLMGYLHLNYRNSTLGVDLNREERHYAYSTTPDGQCYTIDKSNVLVSNKRHSNEMLFRYENGVSTEVSMNVATRDSMQFFTDSELVYSNQ